MMISTKGRYALRVMIHLARRPQGELTSLREIAQQQQISEKYLESIVKKLVQAGLVSGLRGKKGGYCLARPAQACTVGHILRAAEGSLAPVACLSPGAVPCQRRAQCAALPIWKGLEQVIGDYLDQFSLEQLAQQACALEARGRADPR